MILGQVTGNIWSTRKDEKLNGYKFMIVEKLTSDHIKTGRTLIAADNASAGIGDTVLVTTGSSARLSLGVEVPIDAVIVGVVDQKEEK